MHLCPHSAYLPPSPLSFSCLSRHAPSPLGPLPSVHPFFFPLMHPSISTHRPTLPLWPLTLSSPHKISLDSVRTPLLPVAPPSPPLGSSLRLCASAVSVFGPPILCLTAPCPPEPSRRLCSTRAYRPVALGYLTWPPPPSFRVRANTFKYACVAAACVPAPLSPVPLLYCACRGVVLW